MDKADPLLGSISVALSGHVLILTARVRGLRLLPILRTASQLVCQNYTRAK